MSKGNTNKFNRVLNLLGNVSETFSKCASSMSSSVRLDVKEVPGG